MHPQQKRKRARSEGLLIKKAYITLIELLIVIGIIGLSLSIVVFPMKNTFQEWRYRKSLDELSQTLLQAKFLSICYGSDCHVVLHHRASGELEFYIESFEPLNSMIKKKHLFYGAKKALHGKKEVQRISFFASGFHQPQDQCFIIPSNPSLPAAEIKLSSPFSFTTQIPSAIAHAELQEVD